MPFRMQFRSKCRIHVKDVVVGIIGFGHVGSSVYNLLNTLGTKCLVYNRSPITSKFLPSGTVLPEQVDLDTLLSNSDVVSIHISGNKGKAPFITEKELAKMKTDAVLVNTARGYLVDQDALCDALKNGTIRAAAVDVLSVEPVDESNPLLNLDNCIMTPHIAGSSTDTIKVGTQMAVNILQEYLKGNVPHRVA